MMSITNVAGFAAKGRRSFWITGFASLASVVGAALPANMLRDGGYGSLAAFVEVLGLLLFSIWLRSAWNLATQLKPRFLAPVVRLGLAMSLVGVALIY